MSARLIEIFLPDAQAAQLEAVLARHSRRFWREVVPGGQEKYSCIVQPYPEIDPGNAISTVPAVAQDEQAKD